MKGVIVVSNCQVLNNIPDATGVLYWLERWQNYPSTLRWIKATLAIFAAVPDGR